MAFRVLAAVAALFLAPLAQAGHMGMYVHSPVEHDDQGRSDEPDFARTAVLGPSLENRVLDLDLDGIAAPDSALPPRPGSSPLLAPGCTDDSGRRPSGLCGAWDHALLGDLLPAPVCAMSGCPTPYAPGAYTPRTSTRIRFLDVQFHVAASPLPLAAAVLDLEHKLRDTGLRPTVAALSAGLDGQLAGPIAVWAWFGDWQDKNGNGVIDQTPDARENEFVWRGACAGAPAGASYCAPDAGALLGFTFPGTHPAQPGLCPLARCDLTGFGALPGAEPLCFVEGLAPLRAACAGEAGDPLLGAQGGVEPDGRFEDATGSSDPAHRGWVYSAAWPSWHYDQSLLVGHVFVGAFAAPPAPGSPNGYDLDRARFLDVDIHRSVSPDLEALLQGQLKPTARGAWLAVRDALPG